MNTWLRRLRGAFKTGFTWAAGWAPIGAITGFFTALAVHYPLGLVTINYAVMFGVLGFIGGTIFSSVLSLTEGRRTFDQLSLRRFTAWGALGGLLLGGLAVTAGILGPGLSVLDAVIAGAATLLGAGSAATSLVIARAAPRDTRLNAGEYIKQAELTGQEVQRRLADAE